VHFLGLSDVHQLLEKYPAYSSPNTLLPLGKDVKYVIKSTSGLSCLYFLSIT